MAITLQEAKVGMSDKVDQQIVDLFRRNSLLLDNLVFDNCICPGTGGSTLTYGYIQLKTPATAGVRTVGAEYTPGEAASKAPLITNRINTADTTSKIDCSTVRQLIQTTLLPYLPSSLLAPSEISFFFICILRYNKLLWENPCGFSLRGSFLF